MATNQSDVTLGTIVGGSEDQYGITLHVVIAVDGGLCELGFDFYPPDHPDFPWAVQTLSQLSSTEPN